MTVKQSHLLKKAVDSNMTIIVLDACRFDVFKEFFTEKKDEDKNKDKVIRVDSGARDTLEWYKRHWSEGTGAVLIGNNPMPWREKLADRFTDSVALWENDRWTSFEYVLHRVKRTLSIYEDKPVLVHLRPPHLPWFCPESEVFMKKIEEEYRDQRGEGPPFGHYADLENYGKDGNWEEIRYHYRKELEHALGKLWEFDLLEGNVVTSDHGECIGEKRRYGHGYDVELLRFVPWIQYSARIDMIREELEKIA